MDGTRNPSQPSAYYELFDVIDHYDNLLKKATGFMEIAIERFDAFRYLLMMDDDVYLRLDRLVEALGERPPHLDVGGFYAGQVQKHPLCVCSTGKQYFSKRSTTSKLRRSRSWFPARYYHYIDSFR